jgi:hypothetical protein
LLRVYQDLLKCIHHYASTYYAAQGQLFDASRDYRKEKKFRTLRKSSGGGTVPTSTAQGDAWDNDDEGENDDVQLSRIAHDVTAADKTAQSISQVGSGNHLPDELEALSEGDADDLFAFAEDEQEEGESRTSSLFHPRRVRKYKLRRDMYKVFHGSALMAIGAELITRSFMAIANYPYQACFFKSILPICSPQVYRTTLLKDTAPAREDFWKTYISGATYSKGCCC